MFDVKLNDDGTWTIAHIPPEIMGAMFLLADDRLAAYRRQGKCISEDQHAHHAQVTIMHGLMVQAGIDWQVPV